MLALLLCDLILGLAWSPALAADFATQVEPILREHCLDCHAADQQGGLRLDRLAGLLRGGDSGEPAVVPGDPDASYLVKMISGQVAGKSMPPDEALSPETIDLLRSWIAAGAETPASYGPAEAHTELTHWSFQPLMQFPAASGIDQWIERGLSDAGLQFSPRADRRTLIRRLFLVAHGLPPSPAQVEQFLRDERENAWANLVDQVLASPRLGEALATQWLDLVRFGETDGFETNRERPTAWHYRDWVIQAFNDDMPYHEFVRQQLAGDQLGQPLGTGFLVAGPHDIVKGADQRLGLMQRMNELDDMINATGSVFLGLTLGCARCHNHKFDPISQRDYYAMQAIFAGVHHGEAALPLSVTQTDQLRQIDAEIARLEAALQPFRAGGEREPVNPRYNVEEFAPRVARLVRLTIHDTNAGKPCIDELEIYSGADNVALASRGAVAESSGDFEHPFHQLAHIHDGIVGNEHSWIASRRSGSWVTIRLAEPRVIDRIVWARDREGRYNDRLAIDYQFESALESGQWHPVTSSADRQPHTDEAAYSFDALPAEQADLGREYLTRLKALKAQHAEVGGPTMAWIGSFRQPSQTYRLYRGEPEFPREEIGPDAPAAFTSLQLSDDAPESERRLALANWLASPDNPLTARVMVNRLWQFHFGVGLVDTPNDFGLNGTPPTHPELLDWLADQLIQSGWSLKHIHRLILLSRTWQQDSQPHPAGLAVDASSRLLWRFPPRRLQAEAIRDSMLYVSGGLDLQSAGGPGFSVFEVELENVRHYHPRQEFGPDQWRRMIYMTRVRQEKDEVFGTFDCPDGSMPVAARGRSTTPLQALALFNSRFVMQQAAMLTDRLRSTNQPLHQQMTQAWQLCYQRDPTQLEAELCQRWVEEHGLVQLCRALLNSNEFVWLP